jgi:hypothetical protein
MLGAAASRSRSNLAVVEVVGLTGSGKPTVRLVRFLTRVRLVRSTALMWHLQAGGLRAQVGFVLRKRCSSAGQSADIAYGRPGASEEEVIAAKPLTRTNSSAACRTATTRWWGSAATRRREASQRIGIAAR